MRPYKTLLPLDRTSRTPLYLQLANGFIHHISSGGLPPATKLPGSRTLANLLGINRRTVATAYEELAAQGWVEIRPNQGCFVSDALPTLKARALPNTTATHTSHTAPSFALHPPPWMLPTEHSTTSALAIDDGYPDVRLAPLDTLGKNLAFLMRTPQTQPLMTYRQSFLGDLDLRRALVEYLAETRGLRVTPAHILLTRGSLMAFYLLFRTLLRPGEAVIVGTPGFTEGHRTIQLAGGTLVYVPVDAEGLQTDAIEALCAQRSIRAVYIIPHHHYPTTVSLSAARRMHLLDLAERYGFAIVEDDYDYDFHYASSPLLPVASSDPYGAVAYVGSFSKTLAPSLRLGFIVAPEALIEQVALRSRFTDSFGNTALERAVAMLFASGDLRRHLKKALGVYRTRRDAFCTRLHADLGHALDFAMPEGGLAVWARLKQPFTLGAIRAEAAKQGLRLADSNAFGPIPQEALRLGFASRTLEESETLLNLLTTVFYSKQKSRAT
ncbi:MAG: PLP-dependent aminotransferase family protein [Rhodothermales bacterium]